MATTDKKSKSGLGRRNTFQKMLDLEQKNKVNRMRASSTFPAAPTSTPRSPPPPRSNSSQSPLLPMPSMDRAMTAPLLTLPMPPPTSSSNGVSTKYVVKSSGVVVRQEKESSDAESNASSICRSPGWEDYNGKKRKQAKEEEREQKRRDTETTNGQVPHTQQARKPENPSTQSPNRLSKAPSPNKRLTKMAISTDRSASAPTIPTLPTMARGNVKKEDKTVSEKAKRGSLDIGLKGLRSATQAIAVPWKSSQNSSSSNMPIEDVPSTRKSFSRKPGAYNDGGFIGGLKLEQFRQTETVVTQQNKDEPKKVEWNVEAQELSHSDSDPTARGAGVSSSGMSMAGSFRPISIHEDSVQNPQQWDTAYAQATIAARGLDSPAKAAEDNTPIMERNIRKIHRSHPPTPRYFPADSEDSRPSQRENFDGCRSRTVECKNGQVHTQSPNVSPSRDHQLVHDRNTRRADPQPTNDPKSRKPEPHSSQPIAPTKKSYPPESRGRADFVRYRRQEEVANAASALKDESDVSDAATGPKKPRSRRGSFSSLFSRSRSRTRSSSEVPNTTSFSTIGAPTKKDSPATTSFSSVGGTSKSATSNAKTSGVFLDEEYVLNQLHLELNTKASESAALSHKRASSKGPSFQGLRSAAKSAFSRHSIAASEPPTGIGSFTAAPKLPSSKRASLEATSPHISSLMKVDSAAAQSITPRIIQDFALPKLPSRSPARSLARSPVRFEKESERSSRNSTPKALTGSNSQSNHSRSATDSSEDYSTLDESSNITTPNVSRPQSQKDYFSLKGELNGSGDASVNISGSTLQGLNNATSTTHMPLKDTVSTRDSWRRTSADLNHMEDEDRLKTPTENNATLDSTTTHANNSSPRVLRFPLTSPIDTSDLKRKPSLSHSTSTPELQDLSFLPALKHQPLTRPPKGKRKLAHPANPQHASKSPEEAAKALVWPQPIPIPTTKSEGSSPTSPQSSQYLHNARLCIPGAHSPPKTSSPPGPHHPNGPDPIAKMFVVCCQCKYFHDMPSKIYECMVKPDNVVMDKDLGVSGVISTNVKCPWCGHGMGTNCCAGYAAVVYLREKLH
ncbi:hypothetical protein ONS95_012246 [Cadophora gregata]|uniref:uncharacterized protein n=1 Tax=Cadophora gregata TaxID=51156 RepID=UPI0026DC8A13|nr:uncharacterized protein ONS95_012246 [Cadophora gregata]KAK0117934.1 hypothetical protein ONS95_012246 [Cadophora gregata]